MKRASVFVSLVAVAFLPACVLEVQEDPEGGWNGSPGSGSGGPGGGSTQTGGPRRDAGGVAVDTRRPSRDTRTPRAPMQGA